MLSLKFSEKTEKLKKDFLFWLKGKKVPTIQHRVELEKYVEISRNWQQTLAKDNWVGLHWPEQYGGRGLTLIDEAVIQESLAKVNSPQLVNLFALTMVGPVLISYGTEAQKLRFLPKMLSAEEIWCQGFSEPEAGSDLAALKSKAVLLTENAETFWQLNGQKVWTSFAQFADWCFILAKSNSSETRHKNLSYFLMSMKSSGIKISPLKQISGDSEFNELFFDNVKIPIDNIVGEEGQGWKIAISTLMYERVILTFARHLQSAQIIEEVKTYFLKNSCTSHQKIEFGRLIAKTHAIRAMAFSHLVKYQNKTQPGPEGSMDKLAWSETYQELSKFALSILGENALIVSGEESFKGGLLQFNYLYSKGRTIAAGTSEIQRNIIAERVLGLPRE